METVKRVNVVCAIIEHEGRVLATQRGYGEFEGKWEFPGGKVEPGETPEQALVREIREELDADIEVVDKLCQVEYDYPTFHLSMGCYRAILKSNHLELLEHKAAKWVDAKTIDSLDWLPADDTVVRAIKEAHLLEDE